MSVSPLSRLWLHSSGNHLDAMIKVHAGSCRVCSRFGVMGNWPDRLPGVTIVALMVRQGLGWWSSVGRLGLSPRERGLGAF